MTSFQDLKTFLIGSVSVINNYSNSDIRIWMISPNENEDFFVSQFNS
jgi:hypothetical protein